MDSLGSCSSATLDSNRTQDNERYRLPAPVQETVHAPEGGFQGVSVTNDGTAINPNQMVQETFQRVDQLQAEEAERIRSQGEPYTPVAMDLREHEPGVSVQIDGFPTPQLATGGQDLALTRYQPTQTLMAAAGGAGDPENDPNNPRGRGRGRQDPDAPLNGAGRGRTTHGQASHGRSQRNAQHTPNYMTPSAGSNSGRAPNHMTPSAGSNGERPVHTYTQDVQADPYYIAGTNNQGFVPASAVPVTPNLIIAPGNTPVVNQLVPLADLCAVITALRSTQ